MASNYRFISGLANNDSEPEKLSGVQAFCRFNNEVAGNAGTGVYQTSTDDYSLIINTPTYTSTSGAGLGAGSTQCLMDDQPCGSAPQQAEDNGSTDNEMSRGAFAGLGGSVSVGGSGTTVTFPITRRIAGLYVINIDLYETQGKNYTTDWTSTTGNIGFQFNGAGQSKLPGSPVASADFYNVVIPSQNRITNTPNIETGRRLHWNVATGELGAFTRKLYEGGIGRTSILFGGQPSAATSDEAAAGWLLLHGYGLLKNNNLAFTKTSAS